MRNFFDWYPEGRQRREPWLVLGKGPSFQLRAEYNLGAYRLMSLNHAVREQAVLVAHLIDLEVVEACADALLGNAAAVVMPWFPHIGNRAGLLPLDVLAQQIPVLSALDKEGRLLWYDLSTAQRPVGRYPVVEARWFSAEAAIDLLARAGVETIRSLGVDGGTEYATAFDDLANVTRLNNGHISYDQQFEGIAATVRRTGIDYAPLGVQTPIRVFVGSQEEQMLAVKVLEHSIRKNCSMRVEVLPLHRCGASFPEPIDPRNRARTPFSFQRFLIPMLCGFRGRAIYLDSDMLVMKDLRSVWTRDMRGADVLTTQASDARRPPQFSVMLLDCERLQWRPMDIAAQLDSGALSYEGLVLEMRLAERIEAKLEAAWNSLECYRAGVTSLLHYTDMSRQPWLYRYNANGHLWIETLIEAIDAGVLPEAMLVDHVERGWVRPSLLMQVRRRRPRLRGNHLEAWRIDRGFLPPHRKPAAQRT